MTDFQVAAREALRGIAARGHHALLVGGTGLYLRAVVDDLRFPGRYPEVKAALEAELDEGGVEVPALHARLVSSIRGPPAGWSRPTAAGWCGRSR